MNTLQEQPSESQDKTGAPPGKRIWHAGSLVYTVGGLTALFCWLLWGDFAWNMKERAITPVAQVMLRSFTAPDWLVGLLVGSVPAGIGMILGPVISVLSDRHRGRWGRRIPFLLIPTPVITLAMMGLAFSPSLGNSLHHLLGAKSPGEAGSRLIVFCFFWTAFEIATISQNGIFGALINDVVPREVIGRFFALFRAVSLVAGIIFNFYLMGKAQTHSMEIFAGLGLLYGVGFTMMCLKIKEGQYDPPPPKQSGLVSKRIVGSVSLYLRECFTNPFYLWFFLATTLGGLAGGPVNTFSIFHARSVGMSDDFYGKCLAASYTISLLLAYPLGIFADRFHPLRIGLIAMSAYCAVTAYGFFFASTTWTFAVAFLLHTVNMGVYLTGTASINQRLLPSAKFAQFASAAGIIGAICYMILPPTLGVFIQVMDHQYKYVFLLGSLLAGATVIAYAIILKKFNRMGGDKGYTPPA